MSPVSEGTTLVRTLSIYVGSVYSRKEMGRFLKNPPLFYGGLGIFLYRQRRENNKFNPLLHRLFLDHDIIFYF